mgnify:CR=1 FL=1
MSSLSIPLFAIKGLISLILLLVSRRNFNKVNQSNTREQQAHVVQPAPQHPPGFANPSQAPPILQNPPQPFNHNAFAGAVTLRGGRQTQDPYPSKSRPRQDLEEPESDLGDQEDKDQDPNTHDFS